jgi:hypothetical protein
MRALQKKSEAANDKLSPSDLWSAGGKIAEVFSEIRLEQMKSLAALEMSEEEYRDIQFAVYKSAWASEAERESGKMPAEAVSESVSQAAKGMEEAMREGLETAVPRANVELFRKYEADIKKYAMHGLAFIGL